MKMRYLIENTYCFVVGVAAITGYVAVTTANTVIKALIPRDHK